MKFLVDAQLPPRLAHRLADLGHDAIHTRDLPDGNRTTDPIICSIADEQARTVVTKDGDFVDSHVLQGTPARLLLVATGNIGNDELIELVVRHLSVIEQAFQSADFIEMGESQLIYHE